MIKFSERDVLFLMWYRSYQSRSPPLSDITKSHLCCPRRSTNNSEALSIRQKQLGSSSTVLDHNLGELMQRLHLYPSQRAQKGMHV